MSDPLESAYFNKDLPTFIEAAKAARAFKIDKEYSNQDPFNDKAFKKGTALTTIVALAPFDPSSLPYVQALLECGADPNHQNITLDGLTPLENLIKNSEPNYVYADNETLPDTLESLIKLLLSYGADVAEYQGMGGETSQMIDQVLTNYAADIDTETDLSGLQTRLCQEISLENNLTQLRLLAKSLGLPSVGKKADLCSSISNYLVAQAANQ